MNQIIKLCNLISMFLIITLSSCGINSNVITNNSGSIMKNTGEKQLLSSGTRNIIQIQMEKGTEAISELDCNKYDSGGKIYCEKEKKRVDEWKNEVTWGSIFNKGNDYIKNYDCNKIKQDVGKKECEQYNNNNK